MIKHLRQLGWAFYLSAGLMAEQLPQQDWVTVRHEESGLQADFPRDPLELAFEIPFRQSSTASKLRLYWVSTRTDAYVLALFTSPNVNQDWLKGAQLHSLFEEFLAPHFLLHPSIFQNSSLLDYQLKQQVKGQEAFFAFSYPEHGIVRKLKGRAKICRQTLCVYFYLTLDQTCNTHALDHFLDSVHCIEEVQQACYMLD